MEIWGVNDTMRRHAHEFAEAGFVCLVPDLFWRQEPGVELSDHNPAHVQKAFDLYYDFDYDLAVQDMEDTRHFLEGVKECNGKVGAVGYCLGGKLCYLMCCRTDIDCAVAYYGTYIEHNIREVKNLHRPFVLHMAMKDRWVQAEVNDLLERRLSPNPLVTIHKYPGADHAFARHGGKTYSKPEADRALALTVDFFKQHLSSRVDAYVVEHPRPASRVGVDWATVSGRNGSCVGCLARWLRLLSLPCWRHTRARRKRHRPAHQAGRTTPGLRPRPCDPGQQCSDGAQCRHHRGRAGRAGGRYRPRAAEWRNSAERGAKARRLPRALRRRHSFSSRARSWRPGFPGHRQDDPLKRSAEGYR